LATNPRLMARTPFRFRCSRTSVLMNLSPYHRLHVDNLFYRPITDEAHATKRLPTIADQFIHFLLQFLYPGRADHAVRPYLAAHRVTS
jgi:hypothetical protein